VAFFCYIYLTNHTFWDKTQYFWLIRNLIMNKQEHYEAVLRDIPLLWDAQVSEVANLGNVLARLQQSFRFWWIGFYIVQQDELQLHVFQGPVACTRIAKYKGVCGTCWQKKEAILVPDVHQFDGHIACSEVSKSELVVPVFHPQFTDNVWGVLDIDSEFIDHFDATDLHYISALAQLLSTYLRSND
jgi:L-methionine (R)-S-oxide reductase